MRQGGLILAAGRVRSKKKKHEQNRKKTHTHIFLAFSTPVVVSYPFFRVFLGEVPSATSEPRALQLDLPRVNERNQNVLPRAIHRIFQLAQ